MKFFVQQAVLDAGVKILFPVIRGMDNTVESDEWKAYRTQKLHELYAQYAELDVHADLVLEGFNILHDETGVKRRKNIPASENLVKLLVVNARIVCQNVVVDVLQNQFPTAFKRLLRFRSLLRRTFRKTGRERNRIGN